MYRAENTLKPLSPVSIMSSTSNVQNLLTNVFRPTFVYTAGTGYQSRLELTNIDTVSANTVTTFAANVGDASSNVYVGAGSGNAHSVLAASSNTTDTFLGALAGAATSNVKNSVFLGFYAGYGSSNASNSISIGANTANGGNSNIYIGCGTGITTGSNNIFIGPGLSQASVSNTLLIGSGTNIVVNGDLVNKRIGVNLTTLPTFNPSIPILLDVNGYARVGTSNNGMLGVNIAPAYNLDVNGNMRVSDGYGTLIMSNDANCNSTVTLRTTGTYPTATAALVATGGFYSANGTTGSVSNAATSNIGVWKKGLVMVVAQSTSSLIPDYASYAYCITIGTDGTYRAYTSYVAASNITITASTSNIVLTNNSTGYRTYTYSITYFPLP